MTSNADTLRKEIRAKLPNPMPKRLGVAVSGGSDSTALLCLLSDIARHEQCALYAATVDHGLRPEAANEAEVVAALARKLGIPHQTLKWRGWDQTGNLQDKARRARYQLLQGWAERLGLRAIALGHTADDQAETVLMRLARSAGVSGLSAMAGIRRQGEVDLLRPMLSISRQQLRDYLTERGVAWIDDPSNQDERFDRIRVRNALSQLDQIGVTALSLSRVAENLAQAREALAQYAQESARRVVNVVDGNLSLDRSEFCELPEEIQRRLVVSAVAWIAGGDYPPRQSSTDQALNAISAGQTATLGGCLLLSDHEKAWICRELNAVSDQITQPDALWDNRWILHGPVTDGVEIRALGEQGIRQLADWRLLGKPSACLLSSPAVWLGDALIEAPLQGFGSEWRAEMSPDRSDFYASILSH